MSGKKTFRCAIYTRKSTEEGLDQDFNSLDAQREACEAFVASQTGLGWKVLAERYDDGGYSGGTLARPGLQALLDAIKAGRIDVVVVYKIDRLTRSLMDFARIVEIFDANACSFVSVTQAFNTTTSMGRLTLNVLLSFAQFEREVTAERIRDKIAASKKKGMWMGGVVPLGYEAKDRKLVVNEAEAETVRRLFQRYLELKSVSALKAEIDRGGLDHNDSTTVETSRSIGPGVSRGRLYTLLANPIYIGRLRHRGALHDGEHAAIVPDALFAAVQALLAEQAPRRQKATNHADAHWLTGLLFDESGDRLSPAHATKTGRRYRYYVSEGLKRGEKKSDRGWRIPAQKLDALADQQLHAILTDRKRLAGWIDDAGASDRIEAGLAAAERLATNLWSREQEVRRKAVLHAVVHRIMVGRDGIRFIVNTNRLVGWLLHENADAHAMGWCGRTHAEQDEAPSEDALVAIDVPVTLQRRANGNRLVLTDGPARLAEPDDALIGIVARAHLYLTALTDGQGRSIVDIARSHNVHRADVGRLLPLAFLAPEITDAIVNGRHPAGLTARRLSRLADLPLGWQQQAEHLGLR